MLGKEEEAKKCFNKALKLNPDNCYAYCKLSRCYGKLFLKTSKPEAGRKRYRNLAIEMLHRAQSTPSPDVQRIGWLKDWLKQYKIHRPPS